MTFCSGESCPQKLTCGKTFWLIKSIYAEMYILKNDVGMSISMWNSFYKLFLKKKKDKKETHHAFCF